MQRPKRLIETEVVSFAMSRARRPRTLRIDPNALIVADADELTISSGRGVFLIKGQGIQKLHERMRPVLDGRFTHEQLVHAAADKRGAVRKYLDGLKQAGALSEGAETGSLPQAFPSASPGVQTLRLRGLCSVVSLDRLLEPRRRTLLVHVGTSKEVESLLLDRHRITTGTTEVVIEADPTDSLAHRARIARHLLAVALSGGPRQGEFSVYRAGPGMAVRRRVVVRPAVSRQASVWTQMNVVQQADMQQVPLVVFAGEFRGHQARCLGFGVSAPDVEPRVLSHLVARTYLSIAASRNQCITGTLVSPTARSATERVNFALTPTTIERATLGLSRDDCLQALVCSYVLQHLPARAARRCDLLREVPASPRIAMLQRLLRLKRDAYEGYLDEPCGPVCVFRGHCMEVARLGYEATIAEALVRAIAAEYYDRVSADVIAVPAMEPPSSERRRLREALRAFPAPASFSITRFSRLGATFHVGFHLESRAVPDSDRASQ